jgi:5'(3')-deoxyribonucleotidase
MHKKKIISDFDGTLTNSIKQIVYLYDKDFHLYKDYKKIHWTDINSWTFEELSLVNKNIILDYFSDFRFFDKNLEFMDCAKEVLVELNDEYEIFICSLGTRINLRYKEDWLHNNLPFVKLTGVDLNKGNKSSIDMRGAIFIDDVTEYLLNSNADYKVIFGDEYSWNTGTNLPRAYNWTEFKNMVRNIK